MKTPQLRAIRQAQGMSQLALARRAGVHRTIISRLEHGRDSFRPTVQKLAAALAIAPAQFVLEGASASTRVCAQCQRPFESTYAHAVYCSDRCRQRAHRQRKARGIDLTYQT